MPQVSCEELLTLQGKAQHGPPQEAHYPELSPAQSLVEIKDLMALCEQDLGTVFLQGMGQTSDLLAIPWHW